MAITDWLHSVKIGKGVFRCRHMLSMPRKTENNFTNDVRCSGTTKRHSAAEVYETKVRIPFGGDEMHSNGNTSCIHGVLCA